MLDAITDAPAIVGNNRMDIVAANTLGYACTPTCSAAPARPANHSRFIFLDPRAYDFYPDWDRAANVNVAILRRDAGRSPHDPGSQPSSESSPSAATSSAPAGPPTTCARHYSAGAKSFQHPTVGHLELPFQGMELEDFPGHTHRLPRRPRHPPHRRRTETPCVLGRQRTDH